MCCYKSQWAFPERQDHMVAVRIKHKLTVVVGWAKRLVGHAPPGREDDEITDGDTGPRRLTREHREDGRVLRRETCSVRKCKTWRRVRQLQQTRRNRQKETQCEYNNQLLKQVGRRTRNVQKQ